MAHRASVFQTTQIALETTPGTAVPATRRLLCTSIEPKAQVPLKPFTPMGYKAATTIVAGKEQTLADIKGVLSFNDIVYLLNALLTGNNSPTIPGGGTNSRQWLWTPAVTGPDSPNTFTVESGSAAGAEKFAYGLVDTLAMRFTKEEVAITGQMFGTGLVEGITMTPGISEVDTVSLGSPSAGTFTLTLGGQTTAGIAYNASAATVQTALTGLSTVGSGNAAVSGGAGGPYTVTFQGALANAPQTLTGNGSGLTGGTFNITRTTQGVALTNIAENPVSPTQVAISVGNSVGGLVILPDVLEAEISVGNRFTPVYTLDSTQNSFSYFVERAPQLAASIIMEHDSTAAGYMTDLRNKTTKFCRVNCVGALIEGAINYQIRLTFPFKFKENTRGDKDDVWTSTFHLEPIYDSGFGTYLEALVVNQLTAL